MAVEIPFDKQETNYSFSVTLSGTLYTFHVYWNLRSQNYFIDMLRTQDDAVVFRSLRVAVGTPPLLGVVGDARPPGELIVVDTSEKELDPGLYEFGDRVKMIYLEPSELE